MGMLGRYIDGLTDEQKDRIIQAQEWAAAQNKAFGGRNPRCLVEQAQGFVGCAVNNTDYFIYGMRFDMACGRFGIKRIVRACKLRAAKFNFILPNQQRQVKLQYTPTNIAGD